MQLRVHQFSLRSNRSYCKGNEAKAFVLLSFKECKSFAFRSLHCQSLCSASEREELQISGTSES